jgi:hypothetical protein
VERADQLTLPIWLPLGWSLDRLSADERAVYAALLDHVGLARAIKQRDLAARVWPRPTTRRLQLVLKSLTEDHGVAIGTSCREPMGVYLIECEEDLKLYTKNLFARAMSGLRRYSRLTNVHGAELAGQVRLAIWNDS